MYRALFDENGNRLATYVKGLHANIPAEAIPVSEEEQALYATNDYVRDRATGLPVRKPGLLPGEVEAAAWANLRHARDRRLAACEWTDTASAPGRLGAELYNAWQTYRQALRNLPANTADPAAPVWPVPPA